MLLNFKKRIDFRFSCNYYSYIKVVTKVITINAALCKIRLVYLFKEGGPHIVAQSRKSLKD